MELLLAVDPSIRSCGWAIFDYERGKLMESGTATSFKPFPEAAKEVVREVTRQWSHYRQPDTHLVIEYPQYERSMRGKVSMLQGHPLNLACVVGMLIALIPAVSIDLPRPPQWKGNLPKEIHHKRLKKLRIPFGTGDEADAILLGLWALKKKVIQPEV